MCALYRATHRWAAIVNGEWNQLSATKRDQKYREAFRMDYDTYTLSNCCNIMICAL